MRRWVCNLTWDTEKNGTIGFNMEYSVEGGRFGSTDPAYGPEIEIIDFEAVDFPTEEDGTPWSKRAAEEHLLDLFARGGAFEEYCMEAAYDDAASLD